MALFKEHWAIARRKMQPLLGFMCTLDVLGYSAEQYFTIPFTVLSTALFKVKQNPTEINKRMLDHIKDTCIQIILTSKTFRAEMIDKAVNFTKLGAKESHRTADKVKGVQVLLTQFYCFLEINNFANLIEDETLKQIFSDEAKVLEMKRNLTRFAVEEQLRRTAQHPEKITENVVAILFPSYKTQFIDPIWGKRKVEIEQLFRPNPAAINNTFAKYKPMADLLRKRYGSAEAGDSNAGQIDSEMAEVKSTEGVDYDVEIAKLLANFDFSNANSMASITQMNKHVVKQCQQMLHVCSLYLGSEVHDLFNLPTVEEAKRKSDVLLAMFIQNSFQHKNSDRTDAIEKGSYVEIMDDASAFKYLSELLGSNLKKMLLRLESDLISQFKSAASDALSEQILVAPDQYYAAAMMKGNNMFYGNGDFKKCMKILMTKKSADFKDVGNKLVMLKTGHLYHTSKQVSVDDPDSDNEGIKDYKGVDMGEDHRTAIYSDKAFDKTPENRAVNLKTVFKVWSCQVYAPEEAAQVDGALTQRQL